MICHFGKISFLLVAAFASLIVVPTEAGKWLDSKHTFLRLGQFDAEFKAALPFDHYIADANLYQRDCPHALCYDRRVLFIGVTHPSPYHKLRLTAEMVTNVNQEDNDDPREPIPLHLLHEPYKIKERFGIPTWHFMFDLPSQTITGRAFQIRLALTDWLNPPTADTIKKVFDVANQSQLPPVHFKAKVEILGARRWYG